ncbi:AmmeMemoRadiSam system radical SAM enzyme [Desulfobulbus alkaliphilus]|uniref:AmmeMemoRadiSam system radical SAM enzyme n=1 Tax=Desulfobulbus alkaliphilus TaxID=869814 RepID=UPI001963692D|nr:AmmeMemoRadiSam system radical SAM enzyme [Desulfobulbus alkaliphilus]MBM9537666.1 AmmeMemoRadiSam system radical SAM enzyme [Desulfobulbus alkaliphilus]
MYEALLYQPIAEGEVHCGLCHHRCRIAPGRRGVCGVRENQAGRLVSLVYGKLVAEHVDPIEKKPFYHVLPGSRSYSIATVGCNFHCLHCQNYLISQYPHLQGGDISGVDRSPQWVVEEAVRGGCASISYTYVEPTIFYEFAHACFTPAREQGLRNLFVSNGYMTPEAVQHMSPLLDGINIDLKAFSDEFYRRVCKARLEPVLDNIRLFHDLGVWVEVTTLVIPGHNDSDEELGSIARFLAALSLDLPWHVSGFYPTYQMTDRPPTPVATLEKARKIGCAEGLRHVYIGNAASAGGADTLCPGCGALLVHRAGFSGRVTAITGEGCCHACGQAVAGIWQ